jgi:hypothetical protein
MRLAEKISDPRVKAALLEMARAWHNLAASKRHSKNDLVYETPPPNAERQPIIQQQQQMQPTGNDGKA